MTTFGMPTSMFLVFLATVLAGSLGAIHYLIVHVLLRRPFADEDVDAAPEERGEADAPDTLVEPQAFYDCLSFWSPARGLAFSDAAGGRFHVMRSGNGISWEDIGNQMPEPLAGEAAFAASGTCVTMIGDRHGWIATGGAAVARVLATTDHGDSWQAYTTPLLAGPSAGAFTIAFRDSLNGIVAGGTLDTSNDRPVNRVAVSADGGRSWRLVSPPPFAGAVFGLSYVPAAGRQMVVATGPGGAAWSSDEGRTWMELAGVKDYWAVAFTGTTGWLVGTEGRILKTTF
jgi:photosystem II stability/assembly factor-like uncharacterized protein